MLECPTTAATRPRQYLFRRFHAAVLLIALLWASPLLTARPQAQRNLSVDGPWLIYTATDGLVITDPDGSGRTIIAPPLPEDWTYQAMPTPTGDRLLLSAQHIIRERRSDQIIQASADLRLVSLPGGGTRTLHQGLLPDDVATRLDTAALLATLDDLQNPAWTPGGDALVYTSSHDEHPDLYRHSLTGGISQRLTETPAIPRRPVWSPNGRRLLWQASDGENRSVMMTTFASASGSTTDQPPAPLAITLPYRHDWLFVGWLSPEQIIFSTTPVNDSTQANGLYRYDLQNHALTALIPADVPLLPAYDPASGLLLVAVTGNNGELPPGIYSIDPANAARTLIANAAAATALEASPIPAVFILTASNHIELLQLQPEPGAITLPAGEVYFAPTGHALAISEAAAHLTLLTEPRSAPVTVWQEENSPPVWSADGQSIYSIVNAGTTNDAITNPHKLVKFSLRSGQPRTLDEQAIPGVLLMVIPQEVSAFADAAITLYAHAGENSDIKGVLHGDEIITRVRGRNRTGNWLSLDLAGGMGGWVPATQVTYSGDINRLIILED